MPQNIIQKSPIATLGYQFVEAQYLPKGKDEYYLRNMQIRNGIHYRQLTAYEIEVLVRNRNTSDDWNKILVSDAFNPELVKNCKFYGLVRIGKLEPYCLGFSDLKMPVGLYNSTIISCDFGDNVVINNVLSCTDGSPKAKEALAAKAKGGRAFEYLLLVNTYARDYDANSAANDLGVPLVLSEDINKLYKRNTVQEVYDHIFKDLNEALPHLSATTTHRFKPSKQVGNAFMAKMYLYMKDYENARIARVREHVGSVGGLTWGAKWNFFLGC